MDDLQGDNRIPPLHLLLRPSCMLCLEAEYVLGQAGIDTFERVDIERDPALELRYGVRIPVLRSATGRELDWPFDATRIHDWLLDSGAARVAPERMQPP